MEKTVSRYIIFYTVCIFIQLQKVKENYIFCELSKSIIPLKTQLQSKWRWIVEPLCVCASACKGGGLSTVYDFLCRNLIFAHNWRCALPLAWNILNLISPSLPFVMHSTVSEERMNMWPLKPTENWPESFSSTPISLYVLAFWSSKLVVAKENAVHSQKRFCACLLLSMHA